MKRVLAALAVGAVLIVAPRPVAAQEGQGPALNSPGITPFELQRLFDSWALLQAQEFLKISDDQFAKFLPRFKALQDTRRMTLQQRTRVINELRKLVNEGGTDEQLKVELKMLQDIDDRGAADTRRAYEAVDQVLDLHQQAKFRVFEEQMERRKLELVTRARQANRANNPNRQR